MKTKIMFLVEMQCNCDDKYIVVDTLEDAKRCTNELLTNAMQDNAWIMRSANGGFYEKSPRITRIWEPETNNSIIIQITEVQYKDYK